jgi:uncharacterized protein
MINFLRICLIFSYCFLSSMIINGQTEEIVTLEAESCNIEGSLLVPDVDGKIPVVLIIAGSGPTDRNGNNSQAGDNNSYKMLAKNLSESGIASLRYDKRGIGKSSNNTIEEADLRFDHYINDAELWIKKLSKDKRFNEIIVIGHSEGSLIGMVISQDKHVDKYISIAGAGKSIDKILKDQFEAQPLFVREAADPILDSLIAGEMVKNVPQYLNTLFRESIQSYLISWMRIDPSVEIAKLNKPVLIVQGTTDIQVSVNDAELLKLANINAEAVIIEGMNHIFKDVEIDRLKNLATYSNPDLPLNSILLSSIIEFIYK